MDAKKTNCTLLLLTNVVKAYASFDVQTISSWIFKMFGMLDVCMRTISKEVLGTEDCE